MSRPFFYLPLVVVDVFATSTTTPFHSCCWYSQGIYESLGLSLPAFIIITLFSEISQWLFLLSHQDSESFTVKIMDRLVGKAVAQTKTHNAPHIDSHCVWIRLFIKTVHALKKNWSHTRRHAHTQADSGRKGGERHKFFCSMEKVKEDVNNRTVNMAIYNPPFRS